MNDRELLELAAKAAEEYHLIPYKEEWITSEESWNPLKNDGDAFRLMVNLKLEVAVHETYSGTINGNLITDRVQHEDDPYAATRRAIVLTAAKIGEADGN